MVKIQDEEIWSTVPVNSREEFDELPKDILRTIVMGCSDYYFKIYVESREIQNEGNGYIKNPRRCQPARIKYYGLIVPV